MNYKSLIMAVLAGALVATSCMKNLESASVTKVRDAKAEELKSLAELNKAQAAAATTLANAEASLKLAQAKVAEAQAAKLNAETEMLKAQLEYQIAYYKSLIEQISFEMELAAIKHELQMEKAYAKLLEAMQEADAETVATVVALIDNIKYEDSLVMDLAGKIAENEAKIVLLKEGLESIEEYTLEEVLDARAEIARLQNWNEYYKECLKYDSRTLRNTIDALRVDAARVSNEISFLAGQMTSQAESFNELSGKLSEENNTIEGAVSNLGAWWSPEGYYYYNKENEKVVVSTLPVLEFIGSTENAPAEVNVEGLSALFEKRAAEIAQNLVYSKENRGFTDYLYYFVENEWFSYRKPIDGNEHRVTAPYAADWYEKQAAIVAPKLEAAEAAYKEADDAWDDAVAAYYAAEEKRFETILALADPNDVYNEWAIMLQNAVAEVKAYYPTYVEAQEAFGKYNLEDAKEEVRKAEAALALFAPACEKAEADLTKATEAHDKAAADVEAAQIVLGEKQAAYDEAKDAEYAAYVAHELAEKEAKAAAKTAYDDAKKATAKADEALNEAYTTLNKAKNAEAKAATDLLECKKATYVVYAQQELLENSKWDAIAKAQMAEMAVANYAEAEEHMKSLEAKLAETVAVAEAYAVPAEVLAVKEAELAVRDAYSAYEAVRENYWEAYNTYYGLKGHYDFFVESQKPYSDYLVEQQQSYDDDMLALEKAGTALQEILDEKYDSYVAMYERLNTISESYNETSEIYFESIDIRNELYNKANALSRELSSTQNLETTIAENEAKIAKLEAKVAALLDGSTIEAIIASIEHENELLKLELEAHQNILDTLQDELVMILGVETEDSPVQE